MTTSSYDLLAMAENMLRPWALEFTYPEPGRLDVLIRADNLKLVVGTIMEERWGYLAAITGLDLPPSGESEGQVEGLYQFCEGAAVLTVRARVPYSAAVMDSICDLIPSATLYEREFIEMLGVTLRGTPSTDRLLLADDWPDGIYPLRKSFTGFEKPEDERVEV
jgi:Ni,Fe-hydrogenase III component G